ncbi:uncharacterized protein LOC126655605 [Mercurialis annua]|uniref:uncharacterized protein LOC126655605 n=1 Tax=Mercurialis annua TaxID=3986 RepID=UPI0024ACA7A5|nr:uncharacterized protein LOC126655605 [Mercurialis annua]
MFDHLDIPLLSAFVERWQPDTNSFHMPFGEMTITLHDVWHILRIPVVGAMGRKRMGKTFLAPELGGSGARHVTTRKVSASARRKKQAHTSPDDVRISVEDLRESDDFVSSEDEPEDEPRSNRRPEEVDVWTVTGPVPGGPEDDTVIPSFLGHVASRLWDGADRGVLKCQTRHGALKKLRQWYETASEEVKVLIDGTEISHLPFIMFDHLDIPLLSAFVERWQPDTNSFHMPFGEMTITLHDVWHILRIPVAGAMVSGLH